jgi:hypothetical protein
MQMILHNLLRRKSQPLRDRNIRELALLQDF